MPARVVRLRTQADRLRQADAAELRQTVLDFASSRRISDRAVGEIVATIDRETASYSGWTFVMLSPEANNAVVEWLFANSSRPQVAVRLWSRLFLHLRQDTCEVVQTRDELAAALGVASNHISRIMTELESVGAISRQRAAHGVRYYMNPRVGNHLTGAARSKAQMRAAPLNFDPPKAKEPAAKAKPLPRPRRLERRHLSLVPAAE